MEYKKTKPYKGLEAFIQFYWELKGIETDRECERVFPDGQAGIVMNLGNNCLTDNGSVLLGNGTRLFKDGRPEQTLKLISAKTFETGLTQLHYIK